MGGRTGLSQRFQGGTSVGGVLVGRENFPILCRGNGPLGHCILPPPDPNLWPSLHDLSQSIRIPECVRLIQVHFTLDMSICLAGLMSPSKCMRGRPHPSSRSGAHVQRYLTQDHFLSILGPLARYSPCGIGPPLATLLLDVCHCSFHQDF